MKHAKYIGLILVFSVIGFLIWDPFFGVSLSQVASESTQFYSRDIASEFYSKISFALSTGIIPLLYLIVKKKTKLSFMIRGLVSCGIIIVCGVLLWQFRIYQLNRQIDQLSRLDIGNGTPASLEFDSLFFGRYLFIGFLVGTILSIILFRNKSNKTPGF